MDESEIIIGVTALYDKLEKSLNKKLHKKSKEYVMNVGIRTLALLYANFIDAFILEEFYNKKLELVDLFSKMIKTHLKNHNEKRLRKAN